MIAIPVVSQAQVKPSRGVEYTVGPPYPVIDAPSKIYFHTRNDEVIGIKVNKEEMTIQRFSEKTLKQLSRKGYTDFPRSSMVEDYVMISDRLYVLFSDWDDENGMERLYAREVDVDNGTFVDNGRLVYSVPGKIAGTLMATGFYQFGVTDKFKTQVSLKGDQLLVYWRKKPAKRNDSVNKDEYGMVLFDAGMEKISDAPSVNMPYTEEQMKVQDWTLDEKGNVFFVAAIKDTKGSMEKMSRKEKKEIPSRLEVLRLKQGSSDFESTRLDAGVKFLSSVNLFEDPKGGLICAGFSGADRMNGKVDGVFMCKIDANGQQSDRVNYPIPERILTQNVSARAQRRVAKDEENGDSGMPFLVMRDLVVDDDGSVLLVGEQYHFEIISNGRSTYTEYFYQDILATRINADGTLAWMKRLPKNQKGAGGRGGLGFVLLNGGEKHTLFFLDNVKNLDLKEDEVPNAHVDGQGGYLTAYQLDDATGEVTKLSVFDTKDVKSRMAVYQFNTDRIVEIGDNEFIVEFYKKGKQDVLIRVNLTGATD